MHRHTLVGVLLGAAAALAVPAQASKDVLDRSADPNQWVIQTGDYANQRYCKLDQINRDNVKNLKVAWTFSTGVLRGHEGSPLVDRRRHVCAYAVPQHRLRARSQDEGKIIWKYEPKQDPSVIPVMCCDTVNRGVAYAEGKIFLYQADTTLVALDAKTGKEKWKVVNGDPKKGETGTATVRRQGQGDRRHLRRRVRRAGIRHGLRDQDRQARCGAPTRSGPTRRSCSIRKRRRRSASRSARILAQDLERRAVEDRRRLRLGLVLLRSGDQPVLLRHRQPLDLEPGAARRTRWQAHRPEMDDVDHRPRPGHRDGALGLPDDAVRRVGLRRHQRNDSRRHRRQGPKAQGARALRP